MPLAECCGAAASCGAAANCTDAAAFVSATAGVGSSAAGAAERLAINAWMSASLVSAAASTPSRAPTMCASPGLATIARKMPLSEAVTVLTILLVSTSTKSSPALTLSPMFTCHALISPSDISMPHLGMLMALISDDITLSSQDVPNGGQYFFDAWNVSIF